MWRRLRSHPALRRGKPCTAGVSAPPYPALRTDRWIGACRTWQLPDRAAVCAEKARSVTSISPALPLAGVEVAMFGRQGDLRGPRGNYRGSKGDLGVISKGSEGIWRELEGSGGTGGIQRDPAGSSGIQRDPAGSGGILRIMTTQPPSPPSARGYSNPPDSACLVHAFHAWPAGVQADVCLDYLSSTSRILPCCRVCRQTSRCGSSTHGRRGMPPYAHVRSEPRECRFPPLSTVYV